MICRGGVVVGQCLGRPPARGVQNGAIEPRCAMRQSGQGVPWPRMLVATGLLSAVLVAMPGRATIPPLLESDYCYQLTAAERLLAGKGLSATPPVAPHQPWEWRADWAFLTQWPPGYSWMIAALGWLFGFTSRQAASILGILACAGALVGWFTWTWRASPPGLTRALLAAVAAANGLTIGVLINPSTDIIVTAALPWILLLVESGMQSPSDGDPHAPSHGERRVARVGWAAVFGGGLLAGLLFGLRYASAFVPAAVAGWLLVEACIGRVRLRHVAGFALAAAVPVAAVLGVNAHFAAGSSAHAQLNLGQRIGFEFSWNLVAEAWRRFTSFGFYAHHPAVRCAFTLWPPVLIGSAALTRTGRSRLRAFASSSPAIAGGMVVLMLLAMLIAANTFFAAKFNFVGLDRYYLPTKPFYFTLFVAPLMLIPRRAMRACLCLFLAATCWWTLRQDWQRTFQRWQSADRRAAPSGFWSQNFEPNAIDLYGWLEAQAEHDLIVLSNFHEFIVFETGIAALPIPPDREALERWVANIAQTRGVAHPRVLFVLDPDNRWRNHWIPPTDAIRQMFGLTATVADAPACGAQVFEHLAVRAPSSTTFTRAGQ